jgi:hypothetical protein
MTTRRGLALTVIAMAAIVLAGGLMASNMGFKLNYTLQAPQGGVSLSGTQSLGLPYNAQVGLTNAGQLLDDVQAGGVTPVSLQKHNILVDQNDPYPGPGGNFALTGGQGYLLTVSSSGPYIIVGSHNPALTLTLQGPQVGVSLSGTQRYAHPYHGVAAFAGDLLSEIGPNAVSVQKHNILVDQNDPYPGPGGNFALVPGQSYLVTVSATVPGFQPDHY